MSDEKKRTITKLIKIGLIVASIALIGNSIWHWWHCGSVGSDIHQSTDSTMADIKRANESARSELRNSREHLERAEEYVNRAADAVGRSEEAAGANTERTNQLEKLISESRRLAQENQRIMRDVEADNCKRTEGI